MVSDDIQYGLSPHVELLATQPTVQRPQLSLPSLLLAILINQSTRGATIDPLHIESLIFIYPLAKFQPAMD